MKSARHATARFRHAARRCIARGGHFADRALAALGALCLVAAAIAALAGHDTAFNFLFAAGVLLLLVVWFDRWWKSPRRRRD